MASIIEAAFLPFFGVMIFAFALLGVIGMPDAEAQFERATDVTLGQTLAQSVTSSFFKEENSNGVDNYKAISYKLCRSSGHTSYKTEFRTYSYQKIPDLFDYLEFKFTDKPGSNPDCSNGFDRIDLTGAESPEDENYDYEKIIPVIGNETARMRVVYEVE